MTGAIAHPKHHVPAGEDFLLLTPTEQAYAYRNVDRMFVTRAIRRGTTVLPLQRGVEISLRYEADGKNNHGVDAYFGRANVAGLLVIKDERIVLERYALGLEENVRWSSMSMIKSLTSTMIGAALQDGAIGSLDDAVSTISGASWLRLRRGHRPPSDHDVLGRRWNEIYTDRNSHVNRYSKSLGDKVPGGVLALMRSVKAEHRPGSHFNYNSGDTYLLGGLLWAATGKTLADICPRRSGRASAWNSTRSIRLSPRADRRSAAAAPASRCGISAARRFSAAWWRDRRRARPAPGLDRRRGPSVFVLDP